MIEMMAPVKCLRFTGAQKQAVTEFLSSKMLWNPLFIISKDKVYDCCIISFYKLIFFY